MKTKTSPLIQIIKDIAMGTALIGAIAIGLNTDIKKDVTKGQFNNPSGYNSNFFLYEGDLKNPTNVRRVAQARFEPDYVDATTNLRVFGKPIISLGTQRKIPDPETPLIDILNGNVRYVQGYLSEHDKSITTEDGTRYVPQNVGHDSVAYRKQD